MDASPSILRTASPRLLLGGAGALADLPCLARERGVARAVCVGCEAPPECGLPCASVASCGPARGSGGGAAPDGEGPAGARAALAEAVQALEEALSAAAAASVEAAAGAEEFEGTEPAESSDEEGGGTEGVRMRVRVSRGADDKWGIKWHKHIFKKSHRLVVDEISEDSVLERWNRRQHPQLRLRYGDRLVRINGVRTDDLTPDQVAQKMRGELQKERLRALFWRPGVLEPEARGPWAGAPAAVLLCASGEAAVVAAAAAAQVLCRPPQRTAPGPPSPEELIASLGDASELLGPAGESALKALLSPGAAAAAAGVGEEEPADGERAPGGGAEPPHCAVHGAPAEERAAAPPAEGRAAGAEGEREAEVEAADAQQQQPRWTYSCRKCSTALFHDLNVLPHNTVGSKKASRDWALEGEEQASCTSMFVEPMKWMGCLDGQTGRLLCGNPACRQKLGGFSWHGLPCSCGQWQSPAFQIHCARLDCMPAGRRARGPAPQAVFRQ